MSRRTLVIFAKEPQPGRVKTRLASDCGAIRANWWFRHQSARLIREVARDPRWRTILAVSPDRAGLVSRVWPEDLVRWPQGQGDLGRRMIRAFRTMPPGPVMILGSDIPGVTAAHIAQGFARIGSADGVIGPSPDGGYWMIGLGAGARRLPPGLLDGVRWSSPHARSDTLARLAPRRMARAGSLADVDRAADLEALGLALP